MKRVITLSILLVAGWLYGSAPPDSVRVRLFSIEQPSSVRITTPAGESVVLDSKKAFPVFRSPGPVTIERPAGDAVRLQYSVEVWARNGTLVILAEIPLEDYVAAVLAGESLGFRSDESLKAMTVAVRTYALHFLNRHQAEGFDFCDTTHCQDFRITAVNDRLRKAVNDTRGEILRYNGEPIDAYYHQDCGGITEARGPYLPQLQDSFCVARGRLRWTTNLSASDLQSALHIRDASQIDVIERTASGRAGRLRISGANPQVFDAETFRLAIGRTLGWDRIRSDLYEVHRSGDRFVFEGYGSGHGIGMCQDGAAAMGETGFSYKEILAFYYPNTRLSR